MDHTSAKLVEFLRRRHAEDPTRSYPLLPLILLIPEDCEPESAAAVRQAPNVDVLLQHPYDARKVFEAAMSVLTRVQSVQSIYSDIHKFKESRKFAHLPIFDDVRESAEEPQSLQEGRPLPQVLEEASEGDEDEDEDSAVASEVDVEEVDGDVVPQFLSNMRSEAHFSRARTFDKLADPKERAQLDAIIVKSLQG